MDIANVQKEDSKIVSHIRKFWMYYFFIILEALVIVFYELFTDYANDPKVQSSAQEDVGTKDYIKQMYPLYQDIHVMVFIGFGFLMTFLKAHAWSSVAYNFILGAWSIQISMLLYGFWNAVFTGKWNSRIPLDVTWLVEGDFAAASILIGMGAVLGKLSFMQYLVMATIQNVFYTMCLSIGMKVFKVADIGGSMFIHTFGAFFGLSVALMIRKKEYIGHKLCSSSYNSNLFSMIGTIFLWLYWPSFNGALTSGASQHRVFINTVLALTGSCFSTFMLTGLIRKGKFNMEEVLNATISGGVIIGSCADVFLDTWASILIGCGGGVVSSLGYLYLTPWLAKNLGLHDTCGVHNLHGMPGAIGGIIGTIVAGSVDPKRYGDSLLIIFPALKNRSFGEQAGFQFAALLLVIGVGVITGSLTGLLLNSKCFEQVPNPFSDHGMWLTEEEEEEALHHANEEDQERRAFAIATEKNETNRANEHIRIELTDAK